MGDMFRKFFVASQNVKVNKEAFVGLSELDAAGLIALLGYWAVEGYERIAEVYASLEILNW